MANYNLTGQKIKNTYEQLAQVNDDNKLVDGLGNEKQIVTASIQNFGTEVSRSAAEAGFGEGGGGVSEAVFGAYTSSNDTKVDALIAATSSYLTEVPSGTISSSAQVDLSQASGTAVSASHAITASFALNAGGDTEWDNIQNKPSGLVSGSSQVSYSGITDVPSGIVSGAAQLPQIATNTSDIATLTSATSSYLTSLPSGVVSGSSQIDLGSATGTAANATSASYAVSASHLIGGAGGAAGLVAGTGTDSMRSSDDLTTTAAVAGGNYSVVLGEQSTDGSNNEVVAIGFNNEAQQRRSVVIGLDNTSNGDSGIVIGNSNSVSGNSGIVLGVGSQATSNGVTIGGGGANSANNGVTVGNGAAGGGQGAVVLGYNAAGDFDGAVAIGNQTTAQAQDAIVIGNNKSVRVQERNNEINIGDIFQYDGSTQISLKGFVDVNDGGALVLSDWTGSLHDSSILISQTANATDRVNTGGQNNIQIGHNSRIVESSTRDNVVLIGADASAAQGTVVIGKSARSLTDSGVAIGRNAEANDNYTVTIGADSVASANNAILIGYNKTVSTNNEINIGDEFRYNQSGDGVVSFGSSVKVPTSTLTGAGSTVSVDASNSNYFYLNNGGSTTTINNPTNLQDGATYTMKIDDGRNITWGAAYKWPNGVVPTFSSGSDIISFVSIGGTNLYGTAQYNYQ